MTQAIEVDSFSHRNPIPAAARVGPMVWSSLIPPFDQDTAVPEGLASQARVVFRNMAAVLDAANLDWTSVGKVDVWLRHPANRDELNAAWLENFPDTATRPARQVHDGSSTIPPGPALLVATFQAYDNQQRD